MENTTLSERARRAMSLQQSYKPRKRHPAEALPDRINRMALPVYVPSRDNPERNAR